MVRRKSQRWLALAVSVYMHAANGLGRVNLPYAIGPTQLYFTVVQPDRLAFT